MSHITHQTRMTSLVDFPQGTVYDHGMTNERAYKTRNKVLAEYRYPDPTPLPVDITLYEQVDFTSLTCDIGCIHDNLPVYQELTISNVVTRPVPDLFAAFYGDSDTLPGFLGYDQFGDKWTLNWESAPGGGRFGTWVADPVEQRPRRASLVPERSGNAHGWVDRATYKFTPFL